MTIAKDIKKLWLKIPIMNNFEEQILHFIANLNILKKKMATYPSGHLEVRRFGELLPDMILDIFGYTTTISINVIKSTLIVNGTVIDTKNIHIQDFALFISQLGIATINMTKGLRSEELLNFFDLALKIPFSEHVSQHKDILKEINSLNNLRVKAIDFSSFIFTNEDIIDISKASAPLTIWQIFMLYSLSPELENSQDSNLQHIIKKYSQGSLKNFVEVFSITEDRLMQSYITIMHDYIQSTLTEKDDISKKQDFFRSMHKALSDFTPEFKGKVLSATFDAINGFGDESSLKTFINYIPGDLIIEVLNQSILDKKTISPILIKLLVYMYKLGNKLDNKFYNQDLFHYPTWDRLKEFFSREGYEKYLSEEYAGQLQNLSIELTEEDIRPVNFSSESYIKTFQDKNIGRHLSLALLFLMQGNIDDQLYSDFTDTISSLIPNLLNSGEHKDLYAIYRIINKYLEEHKRPVVTFKTLKTSLEIFLDDSFSSKLEASFKSQDSEYQPELEELIFINGVKNLPWLLDHYLKLKDTARISRTLNLICRFGPQASRFALDKLPGSDNKKVISLLKLIQHCAGSIAAVEVRKLLKSKEIEVRFEALKTLLQINDEFAESALWNMVCSKDNNEFIEALRIIHDFEIPSLNHKLASYIKTFIITKTTLSSNKAILNLLSSFGNDDVIPILQKKASAKFSITPKNLRLTHEHLYKTLAKYPKASVVELVQEGINSRNKNIYSICSNLINTGKYAP